MTMRAGTMGWSLGAEVTPGISMYPIYHFSYPARSGKLSHKTKFKKKEE